MAFLQRPDPKSPPDQAPPTAPQNQQFGAMQVGGQMPDPSYGCGCALTHCYAELMLLYLLLSGIHRNISGANFYSLHLLFHDLYERVEKDADRIGEHIRGDYNLKLPMCPSRLDEYSRINFPADDADPHTLIMSAVVAHKVLAEVIQTALCEHDDSQVCNSGTESILESLTEECSNRQYLLKSHLQ